MNWFVRGGLAGLLATGPMTPVIFAGRALGLLRTPPPVQITADVQRKSAQDEDAPEDMPGPVFEASWLISHFGYGAGCGAIYSLLRPVLPRSAVLAGLTYGMVVWSVSYMKLLPRLGLYPRVREDRPSRTAVMIAAHAVYGIALAAVEQRLAQRS